MQYLVILGAVAIIGAVWFVARRRTKSGSTRQSSSTVGTDAAGGRRK